MRDDEEGGGLTTRTSEEVVSNERKEEVETEAVNEEGSKDFCSHIDASVSGHGELMKISNSGTHLSIFAVSLPKWRQQREWRRQAGR